MSYRREHCQPGSWEPLTCFHHPGRSLFAVGCNSNHPASSIFTHSESHFPKPSWQCGDAMIASGSAPSPGRAAFGAGTAGAIALRSAATSSLGIIRAETMAHLTALAAVQGSVTTPAFDETSVWTSWPTFRKEEKERHRSHEPYGEQHLFCDVPQV